MRLSNRVLPQMEGNPLEIFLTEEEYLDILDKLPKENQYLDDNDPNKFIAEWVLKHFMVCCKRLDLDELSLYNCVTKQIQKLHSSERTKH
jgi:hypothetical protein